MEKTTGGRNGTKEDVLDGSRVLSDEEERVAESCPWPIPSIGSHKARRRRIKIFYIFYINFGLNNCKYNKFC